MNGGSDDDDNMSQDRNDDTEYSMIPKQNQRMFSVMDGEDNGDELKMMRLKKLNKKSSRCGTYEEDEEDNEVGGGNNINIERQLKKKHAKK